MDHGVIAQLADPETLYRRPASLFAARFIGSGSLLPTSVKDRHADRATVDLGGRLLTPWCADAVPGKPGMLLLRPEELRLTSPDEGMLAGPVLTSTFLGQSTEIVVATELGDVRLRTEHSPQPDARVGIAWEQGAGVVFADQGA
jgi:ABC-type Fe3+/spermidine/putrescine transport system ATPase subunit